MVRPMVRCRLAFGLLLSAVFTTVSGAQTATCDIRAWTQAVEREYRQHPKAGLADLYKFSHQGIRGSEHAVAGRAGVEQWMDSEVKALSHESAANRAPPIDSLPPDGRYVRVHLRPFLAQGGPSSRLVDAFIATANGTPRPGNLDAAFACARQAIETVMPASVASHTEVATYFTARRAAGWDAVHHSASYEQAYEPAYRVVARELVPGALSKEAAPHR